MVRTSTVEIRSLVMVMVMVMVMVVMVMVVMLLVGLETLKIEHDGLLQRISGKSKNDTVTSIVSSGILLTKIDLGIGEAQVMMALCNHLSTVEAEKQKLKAQVRRLCQENAWLREELSATQQKLQVSEQNCVQLEEEKNHLEYMNSGSLRRGTYNGTG